MHARRKIHNIVIIKRKKIHSMQPEYVTKSIVMSNVFSINLCEIVFLLPHLESMQHNGHLYESGVYA